MAKRNPQQTLLFKQALASAIKTKRISVRTAASIVGINYNTLYDYYSGRSKPQPDKAEQIAKALGFDLYGVFLEEDPKDVHIFKLIPGGREHQDREDCWCKPALEMDRNRRVYVHKRRAG